MKVIQNKGTPYLHGDVLYDYTVKVNSQGNWDVEAFTKTTDVNIISNGTWGTYTAKDRDKIRYTFTFRYAPTPDEIAWEICHYRSGDDGKDSFDEIIKGGELEVDIEELAQDICEVETGDYEHLINVIEEHFGEHVTFYKVGSTGLVASKCENC